MDYLYNGVRLPELPEWDKEKYPYAAMNLGVNYGVLYLLDNATHGYYEPYGGGAPRWGFSLPNGYPVARANSGDAGWSDFEVESNASNALMAKQFKWANFDILNEDGTLYLAASDPVPVTTINPAALMQCFFMGQAFRRMR